MSAPERRWEGSTPSGSRWRLAWPAWPRPSSGLVASPQRTRWSPRAQRSPGLDRGVRAASSSAESRSKSSARSFVSKTRNSRSFEPWPSRGPTRRGRATELIRPRRSSVAVENPVLDPQRGSPPASGLAASGRASADRDGSWPISSSPTRLSRSVGRPVPHPWRRAPARRRK